MQNLDPTGEYSEAEVKAALSGAAGTRNWSFRYDRLDQNNNFIETIDYVQSCTVENNSLADIKRTAKFEILDTGSLNYLKDRIKPWARLTMPKDPAHSDAVAALNPDIWYKADDPAQTDVNVTAVSIPEDTSYSTFATAYSMSEGNGLYPRVAPAVSGVRSTFWAKMVISYPNAMDFVASTANAGTQMTVYKMPSNGTTQSDLVQVGQYNAVQFRKFEAYPKLETYYFQIVATTVDEYPYLEWSRPSRINDSSGKKYHALSKGAVEQQSPILKDNGKAINVGSYFISPEDLTNKMPASELFSGSMWLSRTSGNTKTMVIASGGDAYFELTLDYANMKFQLYNNLGNWAYQTYLKADLAGSNLLNAKHIAWSSDIRNGTGTLWLDGTAYPLVFSVSYGDLTAAILPATITTFEVKPTGGTLTLDDTSVFFNRALTSADVANLYKLGNTQLNARKGYVEWPQGVFLLSSPTRTMKDGNVVTREVEAYDQLLALKEDSFDIRYTVPAGDKYTDAITAVLQSSSTSRSRFPISPDVWATYNWEGSTRFGTVDSSLDLTYDASISGNGMYDNQVNLSRISLPGFSISFKVLSTSTSQGSYTVLINPSDTNAAGYGQMRYGKYASPDGKDYLAYSPPGYNNWVKLNVWDNTANAYIRLREYGKKFYCEVSSDGSTWSTKTTIDIPWGLSQPVDVILDSAATVVDKAVTGYFREITAVGASLPTLKLTKSPLTLPVAMDWDTGTSKLDIINDLLAAINYESAKFDENGIFVGKPYLAPSQRGSEFTYATDSSSVITGDIDQSLDLFKVPNKWIIAVSKPDSSVITSVYSNDDPLSLTSTVSRGRTIVDFRTDQDAPDQVTLDAKAARLAYEASQVYEKIKFDTGLMPIHSDSDVYNIKIDGLAINNKYSETSWSMPLEAGATMSHEVRRINNV